jgi:hypothetical protein
MSNITGGSFIYSKETFRVKLPHKPKTSVHLKSMMPPPGLTY